MIQDSHILNIAYIAYLRVTAAIPGDGGAEFPHTVDSEHDQNEEDPHHHRRQSHLCLHWGVIIYAGTEKVSNFEFGSHFKTYVLILRRRHL